MPIYEYNCKSCGSKFAVLQPATAERTGTECLKCGSKETERIISNFNSSGDGGSCSNSGGFT